MRRYRPAPLPSGRILPAALRIPPGSEHRRSRKAAVRVAMQLPPIHLCFSFDSNDGFSVCLSTERKGNGGCFRCLLSFCSQGHLRCCSLSSSGSPVLPARCLRPPGPGRHIHLVLRSRSVRSFLRLRRGKTESSSLRAASPVPGALPVCRPPREEAAAGPQPRESTCGCCAALRHLCSPLGAVSWDEPG